jgi:heterodisulfide reductase subunit C
MISSILFTILLVIGVALFTKKIREVIRNIQLGRKLDLSDRSSERWATMARVALGQSKMGSRPVAAFFHVLIYVGFIIINIEVVEIIIDGIFGTHRVLSFMGGLYDFLIGSFEFLAIGVLSACVVFLSRRNIIKLRRFHMREMTKWPKSDANIILFTEILLMSAFLLMNACDYQLQTLGAEHYSRTSGIVGAFPISSMLVPMISGMSVDSLIVLERSCWWFHIIGILAFLNYVPYSKHFHILLAFPNTYYSKLTPKGEFTNMESVTNEVKLMMDPSAAVPAADPNAAPQRFGAKDVKDLTWKQLMDSYSCTECGRCTSACPANLTGKLLSPRKIMMDTRDRLEEVGKNIDQHGADHDDGKSLLGNYITEEELWACTTCNACTEACPVNIDPLSIIVEMRRYLVMEQSSAPTELNGMFTKIENNGAPWQFSPADRMNWANED